MPMKGLKGPFATGPRWPDRMVPLVIKSNGSVMVVIYKILLSFVRVSDALLESFTENVIAKMTGNPSFTTPDPTLTAVGAALANFKSAMTAMQQGGTQATLARDAAREALTGLLRDLALYVQKQSKGDPAVMLSSGFDIYNTSGRSQSPLDTPAISGITNGTVGQLTLHVTPLDGARSYETQYCTADGVWKPAPISTQARNIDVPGLTPGTVYTFRVRGVGGSTGFSNWSDPVSHMAT